MTTDDHEACRETERRLIADVARAEEAERAALAEASDWATAAEARDVDWVDVCNQRDDALAKVERLRAELSSYRAFTCSCGHPRTSHTPADFADCTECPHGTCSNANPGLRWDIWHRDTMRQRDEARAAIARVRALGPLFPVPQQYESMTETRAYRDGAQAQRQATIRALATPDDPADGRHGE